MSLRTGASSLVHRGEVRSVTVGPDSRVYAANMKTGLGHEILRIDPRNHVTTVFTSFATTDTVYGLTSDAEAVWAVVGAAGIQRIVRIDLASGQRSELAASADVGGTGSAQVATTIESAGDHLYVGAKSPGGQPLGVVRRYSKADGGHVVVGGSDAGWQDGAGFDGFVSVGDLASEGTALYVADFAAHRLRRVTATDDVPLRQQSSAGTAGEFGEAAITTIAGNGSTFTSGGAGTAAGIDTPKGVVVIGGFAYVSGDDAISKVDLATNEVTVLVGTPQNEGCDMGAGVSRVAGPDDLTTDGRHLYKSSAGANCGITRISPSTGAVSMVVKGRYRGIVVGPDGFLYATGDGTGETTSIWRIDPRFGTRTLFTQYGNSLHGLTADGEALYVVEAPPTSAESRSIVRIDLSTKAASVLASSALIPADTAIESAGMYLYYTSAHSSAEQGRMLKALRKDGQQGYAVAGHAARAIIDGVGPTAAMYDVRDIASDGRNLYFTDENRLRVASPAQYVLWGGQAFGYDGYTGFISDVNPAIGNFVWTDEDAAVETTGPPLTLARTYNSGDTGDSGFGPGWSHTLQMRWDADPLGNVYVLYPDGRRERHTKKAGGGLLPAPGHTARLAPDGAGGYTLTQRTGTVQRFGANGRIVSETDSNGRALTYTYNVDGTLDLVTSASGRTLALSWMEGRITSVTAAGAGDDETLTWRYTYTEDAAKRLVYASDPLWSSMSYEYTPGGQLRLIRRPMVNTAAMVEYYPDGRVHRREDGLGHYTTFGYDDASRKATTTDARSHTTVQTFDAEFRLVAEVNPLGKKKSYAYDARGFRSREVDELGLVRTRSFSEDGDVLSVRNGAAETTWYAYDSAGNLLAERDGRSAGATDDRFKTVYTYDSRNNMLSEAKPGIPAKTWTYSDGTQRATGGGTTPAGLVLTATDQRGFTTEYGYDAKGDLREMRSPMGLRTTYAYDALGRRTSETVYSDTFPAGLTTRYTYQVHRVATRTEPTVRNVVTGEAHQHRTANVYDLNGSLRFRTESDLAGGTPSRTTEFRYDSLDRQTDVIDAQTGRAMHLEYDAAGNRDFVRDQEGRESRTTFDAANRPTTVTALAVDHDLDPLTPPRDVVLHSRRYDDAGRVMEETDALGDLDTGERVRRYAYDGAGRVKSVTLRTYDDRDTTTRDVVLERKTYDAAGNVVSQYEGNDLRLTRNTYDRAGRLTESVLAPGVLDRRTAYSYDAAGNVTAVTTSDGTRTEQRRYEFDKDGRAVSETIENGAADVTTTWLRDRRGVEVGVVDANGKTTTYVTDELGRRTRTLLPTVAVDTDGVVRHERPATEVGYDVFGNATHVEDARGNVTVTEFDKVGRRTAVRHPAYVRADGVTLEPVERWSYDHVGNVIATTDRRGQVTEFDYDAFNRLRRRVDPLVTGETTRGETVFEYDLAGRGTAVVDQRGARTEATYDDLDRVRTQTVVVREAGGPARRLTTTFDYDDLGNRTFVRNPENEVTTSTFSVAGELTAVTDQRSEVWTYGYDVAGRRIVEKDPQDRETRFVYDRAGRLTATERYSAAGVRLTRAGSSYDGVGNVVASVTPLGWTTAYAYDAAGRLTAVTADVDGARSARVSFGHDAVGNVVRFTDGEGRIARYGFNSWGLPVVTVEPVTPADPDGGDRTWTTVYDAAGLAEVEHRPGGVSVTRVHDELGRVRSETGAGGGAAAAARTFGYDKAGLRTAVGHPSGVIGFTFDDAGLLRATSGPGGSAVFGYDDAGRMTSRSDAAGSASFTWTARGELETATESLTGATRTYVWSDARDLVTVDVTAAGAAAPASRHTLSYDALGRLSGDRLTSLPDSVERAELGYGYDADGNVTAQTAELPGNAGSGAHGYEYDRLGRVVSWSGPAGTKTFTYDDAGNRTSAGGDTFVFDDRNRLVSGAGGVRAWSPRGTLESVTAAGGEPVVFGFDALDRQVGYGGVVGYSYDSLDRPAVRGGTAFGYADAGLDPVAFGAAAYVRSPGGRLLAVSDGVSPRLVGVNRHGDVSYLAGPDGVLASTRSYDPFGGVVGETGPAGPDVGFQGDFTDPVSGLVGMGARWYDPSAGGFVSRDSFAGDVRVPLSMNRYAYAHGNPLRFVDPDGHAAVDSNDTRARQGDRRTAADRATDERFAKNLRIVQRARSLGIDPNRSWDDRGPGSLRWAIGRATAERRCAPHCDWDDPPGRWQAAWEFLKQTGKGAINIYMGTADGAISFLEDEINALADEARSNPTIVKLPGLKTEVRDYPDLHLPRWGAPFDDHDSKRYYDWGQPVGYAGAFAASVVVPGAGAATRATAAAGRAAGRLHSALTTLRQGKRVASAAEDASGIVGRRGSPMDVPRGTNSPATIDGRQYGGHALDEMMSEGLTPSVVDDAIRYGQATTGASSRVAYYSSANNVTVIVENGRVVTVSSDS